MSLTRIAANRIINASEHTERLDELFFTKLDYPTELHPDFEHSRFTFYRYSGFKHLSDDAKAILFDAYVSRLAAVKLLRSFQILNITPMLLNASYAIDTRITAENFLDGIIANGLGGFKKDVLLRIACHSQQLQYLQTIWNQLFIGTDEIPMDSMNLFLLESRFTAYQFLFDRCSANTQKILLDRHNRPNDILFPLTAAHVDFIWSLHIKVNTSLPAKMKFLSVAVMNGADNNNLELCQYAFSLATENQRVLIADHILIENILTYFASGRIDIYNWFLTILSESQINAVKSRVATNTMVFSRAYTAGVLESCNAIWGAANSSEKHEIYRSLVTVNLNKSHRSFYPFTRFIFRELPIHCQYNLIVNTDLFILALGADDLAMCQHLSSMLDDWLQESILTRLTIQKSIYNGNTELCEWLCNHFQLDDMLRSMDTVYFIKSVKVLQWYLARIQLNLADDEVQLKKLFTAAFKMYSMNAFAVCQYICEVLNVNRLDIVSIDCDFIKALNAGKYDLCYLFWRHASSATQASIVHNFAKLSEFEVRLRERAWLVRESSGDVRMILMQQHQCDSFNNALINFHVDKCHELWEKCEPLREQFMEIAVSHFVAAVTKNHVPLCEWVWARASADNKIALIKMINMDHIQSTMRQGGSLLMLEWILKAQCEVYSGSKRLCTMLSWERDKPPAFNPH